MRQEVRKRPRWWGEAAAVGTTDSSMARGNSFRSILRNGGNATPEAWMNTHESLRKVEKMGHEEKSE
jgi:hypothetical protein